MWDLATIVRINQKAAEQGSKGLPERDAVGLATGSRAESQPKAEDKSEGEIIKLVPRQRLTCECCVG